MQNLNVSYCSQPEQYSYFGRITSPGASFVLTAGAAPKFTVSRTGAGVYVVTLNENPVLFLGANLAVEGVQTTGATATNNAVSYVFAPAVGATKATVTFYTAVVTSTTAPATTTTLTDLPFSFSIFCADTARVA